MTDVFISYSSNDEKLADFLRRHMEQEGLEVFLASVSLEPGDRWSKKILEALKEATWVFFLGSRDACSSQYVQQEMGGAIYAKKRIIPVVWEMPASELPGWLSQWQALNLAEATVEQVQEKISAIAKKIRANKTQSQIIGGIILAGLAYFAFKGE